jgi:hypothetical protein
VLFDFIEEMLELLIVPVIYATFVLDLKMVKWNVHESKRDESAPNAVVTPATV